MKQEVKKEQAGVELQKESCKETEEAINQSKEPKTTTYTISKLTEKQFRPSPFV